MKLTDKRFWILLALLANTLIASAQTIFSVEEITEQEYLDAEKECSRFNIYPADSITDNEIVTRVLKESQAMFERFDSVTQQEIVDFVEGNFGFDKQQLLYLPKMKLYGFVIPESPFNDSVWWFDSGNGKFICSAAFPTAINTNGIYVQLRDYDCDFPLDLRFFRRDGNSIYEFESYKNIKYNSENVIYPENTIFWYGCNTLFLKTYDREKRKEAYIKIQVGPSFIEMLENAMPNKVVRPAPKKSVRNRQKGGKR